MVGSGIAGLSAALTAAPHARVALLTKGAIDEGCTRWAQGGLAAAIGDDDSAQQHFDDTVAAGRGLCDERAVRLLVERAPAVVERLTEWGVEFDSTDGKLVAGQEAAHGRPRILHAGGDATGHAIESALVARLRGAGVTVMEHHNVLGVVVRDGRCAGVEAHDHRSDAIRTLGGAATILANGGAGRLWGTTTNPSTATGDGVTIAYTAGAEVAGMEFVQFHPTALALAGAPPFLLSEAMRGEGAVIVNSGGERFLFETGERGELAGRDVVSQAIWRELSRTGEGSVYLDIRSMGWDVVNRFPTIHRTLLGFGIDITSEVIPIAPAAHYLIGGVRTDLNGATRLPALYACGEVASTGVHGANRLASNSLLEGAVFGIRAADAAVAESAEMPPPVVRRPIAAAITTNGVRLRFGELTEELHAAMWDGCGLVRDAAALQAASAVTERMRDELAREITPMGISLRNAVTTGWLVCAAASARTESRGSHFRSDYPDNNNHDWHGTWVMHQQEGAHLDRNT